MPARLVDRDSLHLSRLESRPTNVIHDGFKRKDQIDQFGIQFWVSIKMWS